MNYLNKLAKDILRLENSGFPKVRFAKTIYFVHKGLAQKNLVDINSLKFIRMPLGPVPKGFKELEFDSDINVRTSTITSLIYNMQIYELNSLYNRSIKGESDRDIIEILSSLRSFSTSDLVEISHKEPSWLNLVNGDEFFVSNDDLRISLPIKINERVNEEIDEQRLQAKLVEGMLDDIVSESTSLEYPDNNE